MSVESSEIHCQPEKMLSFSREPWSSPGNNSSNRQPVKFVSRIYWLLLPISDWLDGLIGPSELLLLVSHLRAVPVPVSVSVLCVGLEKDKKS